MAPSRRRNVYKTWGGSLFPRKGGGGHPKRKKEKEWRKNDFQRLPPVEGEREKKKDVLPGREEKGKRRGDRKKKGVLVEVEVRKEEKGKEAGKKGRGGRERNPDFPRTGRKTATLSSLVQEGEKGHRNETLKKNT